MLRDCFLEKVSPAVLHLWLSVPELETQLLALWQAGHDAWPQLNLDAQVFVRHVGACCSNNKVVVQGLGMLDAAGLYLACACLQGNALAVKALDSTYFSIASDSNEDNLIRDPTVGNDLKREVLQRLRTKLLFAEVEGKPPKLVAFNGSGRLRSWLRVTAGHELLDHYRRVKVGPVLDELPTNAHGEATLLEAMGIGPFLEEGKHLGRIDRERLGAEFKAAFAEAVLELRPADRTLLRLRYKQQLGFRKLGLPRATAEYRLQRISQQLSKKISRLLRTRLGLSHEEVEGLAHAVAGQISLSLSRILRDSSNDGSHQENPESRLDDSSSK